MGCALEVSLVQSCGMTVKAKSISFRERFASVLWDPTSVAIMRSAEKPTICANSIRQICRVANVSLMIKLVEHMSTALREDSTQDMQTQKSANVLGESMWLGMVNVLQ